MLVDAAVNFDDEARLKVQEVDDVWADWMLTPKPSTAEAPVP